MIPPPARPRTLTAALLALALAACGGDAGERADGTDAAPDAGAAATVPAQADATAAATAPDPCTLLEPGEVSAATGVQATAGTPSTSGGAQVCTWTDAEGRSAIVQVHPSAARYEQSRTAFESMYGGQAEPADLGDQAFYIGGRTGTIPTGTAGVLRGQTTLSAQVMGMEMDAETLRSAALELAQRAVQKL